MPLTIRELEYQQLFAHDRAGVVLVSRDYQIERSNPAASLLLGYSPAELEGRDVGRLVFVEERVRMLAELAAVFAGTSQMSIQQTRLVAKFGVERAVQFNSYPVHYEGEVVKLLCITWPIDGYRPDELMNAIQQRIEQMEIRLTHHDADDKKTSSTTVHIGDSGIGGDKVGRDKNSVMAIYLLTGVVAVGFVTLIWLAYYFHQHGAVQPPPNIPGIERPKDNE